MIPSVARRFHASLAELRQRNAAVGRKEHQFKLSPPVLPEVLEAFEEKHQVRLPGEYRAFLLEVGNGGAGPIGGLYSLEDAEAHMSGDLAAPSPFLPAEEASPDWLESLNDDAVYDRIHDGVLPLADWGDTAEVVLIVTGPHRGRIVYVDWQLDDLPFFSPFPEFLAWYEGWLRDALAGYRMRGFGFGLPLDLEQSLAVAVDTAEVRARRVAALSNLVRAPRLPAEEWTHLRQATIQETDAELAAEMGVCLAQTGGPGLGEVLWQVLKGAPSDQYLRLVQAMRDAGLPDWEEAAWWAVEQDADDASVRDLLTDLDREGWLTRRHLEKVFAQRHGVSAALYLNSGRPDPLPVPPEFFTHASSAVRRYAAQYQSAEALQPQLSRLLELFFQEKEVFVRQGWAFFLMQSGVPRILEALMTSLKVEQCHEVRSVIITQLGVLKVERAVPLLLESALNDNWILAMNAVTSLTQIGTPEARRAVEAVVSTDPALFRGTGQGIVTYPQIVINMATKQLQALA